MIWGEAVHAPQRSLPPTTQEASFYVHYCIKFMSVLANFALNVYKRQAKMLI